MRSRNPRTKLEQFTWWHYQNQPRKEYREFNNYIGFFFRSCGCARGVTLTVALNVLGNSNSEGAVYNSHSAYILEKGMNPTILPTAIDKQSSRLGFFNLGISTALRTEKLWIQTCSAPLKSWTYAASYLSRGVG